jgi:tetratricopeptide (TPR) repeat protein
MPPLRKKTSTKLQTAIAAINAKASAKAIPSLDETIAYYEKANRQPGTRAYSARSPVEGLAYMMDASQAKITARTYTEEWGAAYYYKAYALIDLARVAEAKTALDAAIELAPRNARYLSERGHIDAVERNWPASLMTFKKALEACELSPADVKLQETTRALRGMAFAQVELKDLAGAEALHRRVLELDPADVVSRKELQYIQKLRARPAGRGVAKKR